MSFASRTRIGAREQDNQIGARGADAGDFRPAMNTTAGMLPPGFDRVRRKLRGLRGERRCARQRDPLTGRDRPIVTTFYDVEGDYARRGATPAEIESIGRILEIERRCGIRSTYNIVGRFAL